MFRSYYLCYFSRIQLSITWVLVFKKRILKPICASLELKKKHSYQYLAYIPQGYRFPFCQYTVLKIQYGDTANTKQSIHILKQRLR